MVLQIRPERSQVWLEFPGNRDSGHGAKGYAYLLLLSGYSLYASVLSGLLILRFECNSRSAWRSARVKG